ncbi:MAG: PspC domain-containing protein [Sphingomicrobium sp.]
MQDPRSAVQDQAAPVAASVAAPATTAPAQPEPYVALPLRHDTILGVCEALGQEFGFHSNWLRVVFAALVLWNPIVIMGIYLAIGAGVALARWLFPRPHQAIAASSSAHSLTADNADHRAERLAA